MITKKQLDEVIYLAYKAGQDNLDLKLVKKEIKNLIYKNSNN